MLAQIARGEDSDACDEKRLLEDDSQLVLRWSINGTNGPGVLDKLMRRFIRGKYEVILGAWGNMNGHR